MPLIKHFCSGPTPRPSCLPFLPQDWSWLTFTTVTSTKVTSGNTLAGQNSCNCCRPWLRDESQIVARGILIKNVIKVRMKTQSLTDRESPARVFAPSERRRVASRTATWHRVGGLLRGARLPKLSRSREMVNPNRRSSSEHYNVKAVTTTCRGFPRVSGTSLFLKAAWKITV